MFGIEDIDLVGVIYSNRKIINLYLSSFVDLFE